MDFRFERPRVDKIQRTKIIEELEKTAKYFNYNEFGRRDFSKASGISDSTVCREFGTWRNAIRFLSNHLKEKRIILNRKSHKMFAEMDIFNEMERIWRVVGHRPSKYEWTNQKPKVSYATVRRYFGGWQKACLKFIEYKMGGKEIVEIFEVPNRVQNTENKSTIVYTSENSRTIPLGLRLKVLNRDNFRCRFCGRSPATNIGVILHIDHITPFSKGGKNILENLQVLCEDCNLGKSDQELNKMFKPL